MVRRVPRVLHVSATTPEPAVIADAAAVLARGGLVAFPTETVYGLGARGLHAADVIRIFAAKERPNGHPLILHVDGEAMARSLASTWPAAASRLADAFWPGPLTMIVPRAPHVPDAVTGGLDTVGLRMPVHPVALALIRAVGEPLAAPSANAHMHISPTAASHVVRSLGDRVDLVLDAGPSAHGIESTVVDLVGAPRVLRAGALGLDALRAVLPEVTYDPASLVAAEGASRASPGLASRHYAPRTHVVLTSSVAAAVAAQRGRIGAVTWSHPPPAGLAFAAKLPAEPDAYAAALFATLHDADAAGLDSLVVEHVPDRAAWWAVRDRLARAATP